MQPRHSEAVALAPLHDPSGHPDTGHILSSGMKVVRNRVVKMLRRLLDAGVPLPRHAGPPSAGGAWRGWWSIGQCGQRSPRAAWPVPISWRMPRTACVPHCARHLPGMTCMRPSHLVWLHSTSFIPTQPHTQRIFVMTRRLRRERNREAGQLGSSVRVLRSSRGEKYSSTVRPKFCIVRSRCDVDTGTFLLFRYLKKHTYLCLSRVQKNTGKCNVIDNWAAAASGRQWINPLWLKGGCTLFGNVGGCFVADPQALKLYGFPVQQHPSVVI